jgi:hypothetical protein
MVARRLPVSGFFPIPSLSRRCPFYQQRRKEALNVFNAIFSDIGALRAF